VFEAVEVADYLAQETSTDLVFQNIGGDRRLLVPSGFAQQTVVPPPASEIRVYAWTPPAVD
jgi:hypothetical protein